MFSGNDRTYRSDCDNEDVATMENIFPPKAGSPNSITNRSPLLMRQNSPFPLDSNGSRRIHYTTAQERIKPNGELFFLKKKRNPNLLFFLRPTFNIQLVFSTRLGDEHGKKKLFFLLLF